LHWSLLTLLVVVATCFIQGLMNSFLLVLVRRYFYD
jgi:hypothetical protein